MNIEKAYIVIPAYNEEKNISSVVKDVLSLYKNVIVVNDNSKDRTSEKAKEAGAFVIDHVINRGQGAALETGDRYALGHGAEIIVHFDADGQFQSSEIGRLLKPILDGEADIVMGSRFLDNKTELPKLKKYIIMPLARIFLGLFYGAALSDPQNGFRAFNRTVASKLIIENDGAAHCTEIIVKILKNKWRYKEVPVTVKYDAFGQGIFSGKGRGSGGIKIIKSLLYHKLIK